MSELQSLLQYQEVDAGLKKIEQELATCDERKKFSQARRFLENAGDKLEAMDAKAAELKRVAQLLTKKYLEMNEILKDFSNVEELIAEGADVTFYLKNAQALSDGLKALKSDINGLISKINAAADEYKKLKAQTIKMQKQYNEYKEKYYAFRDSKKEETQKINAKLAEIEKSIPPDVMARYKTKRKESLFPVLCPLKNNRCSSCGMDLPLAAQNRLSGGNIIECDNCHRFIYTEA